MPPCVCVGALSQEKKRFLMLGLDNSGKTSLLVSLLSEDGDDDDGGGDGDGDGDDDDDGVDVMMLMILRNTCSSHFFWKGCLGFNLVYVEPKAL